MYALIYKAGSFLGFFSSKKIMKMVIEEIIKDDYETNGGPCGDYHFQYVKFDINEPWIDNGKPISKEAKAILSLWTMHPEKFTHKVKTDWSTGKIISMDSD